MLISKSLFMEFEGYTDSVIYSDYYFGGDFSIYLESAGDKIITIYGYNEKSGNTVFMDRKTVLAGVDIVDFSFSNVVYNSLVVKMENTVENYSAVLLMSNEYDVIENTEQTSVATQNINTSVLYGDIPIDNRSVTIKYPKEQKEITQSLLQKKVYFNSNEYQITSVPSFNQLDTLKEQASFTAMRVINV